MLERTLKLTVLPAVLLFASVSFTTNKNKALVPAEQVVTTPMLYSVPTETEASESVHPVIPFTGNSFVGFKEALAFKESRGNYFSVNEFGYMGKYQFGRETLALYGIRDTSAFLRSSELQEKAFILNTERNKWVLRKDIARFVGERINGVLVTESGVLAAAHLAGPGNVKKYLRSYGRHDFQDAFGTSIQYYMKRFSGYDTSSVAPIKNPRV